MVGRTQHEPVAVPRVVAGQTGCAYAAPSSRAGEVIAGRRETRGETQGARSAAQSHPFLYFPWRRRESNPGLSNDLGTVVAGQSLVVPRLHRHRGLANRRIRKETRSEMRCDRSLTAVPGLIDDAPVRHLGLAAQFAHVAHSAQSIELHGSLPSTRHNANHTERVTRALPWRYARLLLGSIHEDEHSSPGSAPSTSEGSNHDGRRGGHPARRLRRWRCDQGGRQSSALKLQEVTWGDRAWYQRPHRCSVPGLCRRRPGPCWLSEHWSTDEQRSDLRR